MSQRVFSPCSVPTPTSESYPSEDESDRDNWREGWDILTEEGPWDRCVLLRIGDEDFMYYPKGEEETRRSRFKEESEEEEEIVHEVVEQKNSKGKWWRNMLLKLRLR